MAAYVDFEYYEDTYLGIAIPEASFSRIALRASEIVDRITYQRAEDDTDNTDAIKMANCAVADVFYSIEEGGGNDGVKSEKIGDHSVTYSGSSNKTKPAYQQYQDAAAVYLGNTGLMFAGFKSEEYAD